MTKQKIIEDISNKNNGTVRLAELIEAGISRQYCLEYLKNKEYEKIARGIYLSPDAWGDDFYVIHLKYHKAVFSHETALYLLELADREPVKYTVTLPHGYKVDVLTKSGIMVYTLIAERYQVGIRQILTPGGHMVPCYDAERTICDVFRSEIDAQDKQVAVKEYLKENKNIPKLMEYAKIFRVDKKIKQYLEALL